MVLPSYPLAPGSTGDSANAASATAAATSQIAESAFSLEPMPNDSSLAGTERLAASIVERVLGPALSMTAEPATSLPQVVHLPSLTIGPPPMSWLEGLGSTALSAVTSALQQSSSCASGLFSTAPCPMDTSEPAATTTTSGSAGGPATTPGGAPFEDFEDTREAVAAVDDVTSETTHGAAEDGDTGVPVPAQPPQQRAGESAGPSASNDYSSILGDVEIPEGVDPSFLAALPENIRQEVIAEQLRLQRLRTRAQQQQQAAAAASADGAATFTEVNPEFLAALPPSIQEEATTRSPLPFQVLAQQRAEQQRLAAQNCNPDVPVDPASFIQTLPPG
ncbi:unnamed protein product, partial [Ixodes pacificus]